MIETTFETTNQMFKRTDSETIVNKSKNIVRASFTFEGEIWDDEEKFVIFTDAWGDKTTTHLGKSNVSSCILPSSILEGEYFSITVYGGDLITTNEITIVLSDSGYTKYHHDCDDKGKDIFIEIFERLDKAIDNIIVVEKCLHCFSNGELVDTICLNNFVDETQFNELIQNIVTKNEIQQFLSDEGYIKNLAFDFETGELIFEK